MSPSGPPPVVRADVLKLGKLPKIPVRGLELIRIVYLYEFWPERKEALRLWHEKIERLREQAVTRAA